MIAGWSLPHTPPGSIGFVYLPALFTISFAGVVAAPIGARTAHRLELRQLRRGFACLLFGRAAWRVYKATRL